MLATYELLYFSEFPFTRRPGRGLLTTERLIWQHLQAPFSYDPFMIGPLTFVPRGMEIRRDEVVSVSAGPLYLAVVRAGLFLPIRMILPEGEKVTFEAPLRDRRRYVAELKQWAQVA